MTEGMLYIVAMALGVVVFGGILVTALGIDPQPVFFSYQ